jgi:hypothetical protein
LQHGGICEWVRRTCVQLWLECVSDHAENVTTANQRRLYDHWTFAFVPCRTRFAVRGNLLLYTREYVWAPPPGLLLSSCAQTLAHTIQVPVWNWNSRYIGRTREPWLSMVMKCPRRYTGGQSVHSRSRLVCCLINFGNNHELHCIMNTAGSSVSEVEHSAASGVDEDHPRAPVHTTDTHPYLPFFVEVDSFDQPTYTFLPSNSRRV